MIQGGPGTGKTAVGLHRASWLLYTARERHARSRVLVVGPNRTFMEYVSHVLPALGEHAVEQRAVSELVDGVETSATEPATSRGSRATSGWRRSSAGAGPPPRAEPDELLLRLDGAFVRVRVRDQERLLEEIRAEHGTTAAARERFRMGLVRSFYGEYARLLEGGAFRDAEQVERALRSSGELKRVLDLAWPAVAPEQPRARALHDPAIPGGGRRGRPGRRRAAAPAPSRAGWGDGGRGAAGRGARARRRAPRAFDHVIVDEAQDLSPMQLRMIARRAKGRGVTMLGDIAQGTGSRAYESWDEVVATCPAPPMRKWRSCATRTACPTRSWRLPSRCSTRSRR